MTAIDRTVGAVGREIPRIAVFRRRDLLAEVRGGLEDATEDYGRAGLSETDAQERAAAEFGDPGRIGRELATTLVARSTRRTAALLGPGYLLMLAGWALFGRGDGHQLSGVGSLAVGSFGWLGVAAVLVAGAAVLLGRRRERPAARLVGTAGVAVAAGTWVAANLVAPWGGSLALALTRMTAIEAVSLVTTSVIFLSSAYSLALTARPVRA